MRVSIFGLGYVGAVTSGCLWQRGFDVIGVDVQQAKVDNLNMGQPLIVEPGLDMLLFSGAQSGRIRATTDVIEAVSQSEISLVCVGTPSQVNGALNIQFVRTVVQSIAQGVRQKPEKHILILRSTMLPGSTRKLVVDFLNDLIESEKLEVYFYPEFLREGTAVSDFENPSLVVIGTRDGRTVSEKALRLIGSTPNVTNWETAELIKYGCNAFHALKIGFANEMGRMSKHLGIDGREVMNLICNDEVLNISRYYMRPGNPFGGSCLPKDVRALVYGARMAGESLPILENILDSNEVHFQSLVRLVEEVGEHQVSILGVSFKAHTDDLRESSMVKLAQLLVQNGYRLRIYDPNLDPVKLLGSNKKAADDWMPNLSELLYEDLREVLGDRGVVVISQKCADIEQLKHILTPEHTIVDVNSWPELQLTQAEYRGLCW
ncbi:MAG: nucleotide sugar dehydrogenase [Verrucomicrobia bacterium]|nr:nucleotide sugar dehydrogenase [Verrucomicrobiota bacterium]